MARYIDADALIKRLGVNKDCAECSYCTRKYFCSWNPDPGEICIAISEQPTVTINDHPDEIKVTNCNDNISRQAICDALDKVFADRIKSAGFDSYETADRDTQLVCDGIMKAIDVVLDQPTVDHLSDVSKKDLISRADVCEILSDMYPMDGEKVVRTKCIDTAYDAVLQLPTAQPDACENTCEIERKSNDTISRQDAIDKFIKLGDYYDGRDEVKRGIHQCIAVTYELPSAQPEYTEQDVRDSFNSGYACGMEATQPERKRGEWIIDHLCSTSGGTYQVLRCSICEHSEPWQMGRNFCPNCGAQMQKEGSHEL